MKRKILTCVFKGHYKLVSSRRASWWERSLGGATRKTGEELFARWEPFPQAAISLDFLKSPSLLISGSGGGPVREARPMHSVFGIFRASDIASKKKKENSEHELWASLGEKMHLSCCSISRHRLLPPQMVPYFNTTTTTTKKGLKPEKVKNADQHELKLKELT